MTHCKNKNKTGSCSYSEVSYFRLESLMMASKLVVTLQVLASNLAKSKLFVTISLACFHEMEILNEGNYH